MGILGGAKAKDFMPFAQVPGADDLGFEAEGKDIAGFLRGGTRDQHILIQTFGVVTGADPIFTSVTGITVVNNCDFITELIFVVIAVAGGFLGVGADTVTDDLVGNAAVGDEFNG